MNLSTLSPLRYPGGKSWLAEDIERWLQAIGGVDHFVEPFAGGANVGLYVLAKGLVSKLTLVEKDPRLVEFWQAVLNQSDLLVDRIVRFKPTKTNLLDMLAGRGRTPVDRAFRSLLRNRVARGGVLAPRSGILKKGENGRGVFSRWYPDTLVHRIQCIASLKEQIDFVAGDGLKTIRRLANEKNAAFFVDPPYSGFGKSAGSRLYSHWQIDHWKLFELCSNVSGHFVLTYEDTLEIEILAAVNSFEATRVPMLSAHHSHVNELLIARDLSYISA